MGTRLGTDRRSYRFESFSVYNLLADRDELAIDWREEGSWKPFEVMLWDT